MDLDKALDVLVICLPVFAVMGLGKLLDIKGWITTEHRRVINNLIYYLALPALILNAVAQQRFSQFLNPALLLPGFISIAILTAIYACVARAEKYRHGFAAAFVFGTFWANVTYMGFPLAKNAFGDEGLALAAVYNAFLMPAFIMTGFAMIGVFGKRGEAHWTSRLRETFTNPIILAAFVGIILASVGELFRNDDGDLGLPALFLLGLRLSSSFLQLIGSMGLPLALLTIGAALHFGKVKEYRGPLIMVVAGKLILMPLLTLGLTRWLFPDTSRSTLAVAVLLAAMPNAVASYVVAAKAGVDEGYISSMLVISTAISVISVPAWLYIVL